MKRNGWIVISIIVVNIFILCGCVFLLMQEDNTPPEFRFQPSDYTYLHSDGEDLLLDNIIAYDNQDGNITERIVIEKIVENEDSSTAVVYYAVSDMAGNVTKVSRIFPMEPSDEVPEYVTEQQKETNTAENETGEAAGSEETEEENGQESSESDADSETEDDEESRTQDEEDADAEPDDEEEEDEEAAADEDEPEPEPVKQAVDKSGYPMLTLKKSEVTIQEGTSPPWTELIETLRDDKDDYTTLYYNLHISKFTSGKAGDYPVTLQAEDSDGNLSDSVTVMVHVRK